MHVLFVCTANICRSAISEALLKRMISAYGLDHLITVESAGIEGMAGAGPNESTIDVCKRNGVDITAHRARQLTKEMLDQADLVFCLAEIHREIILNVHPEFKQKVVLLKEFEQLLLPRKLSVEDPVGRGKKYYELCFEEIDKEIRRIFPMLRKHIQQSPGDLLQDVS